MSHRDFSLGKFVFFPRGSQLWQSRATQSTVHAGCSSVSIIHRTLTWTTGSLTCEHMLTHAIAHGGVRTHVRESTLKVDSGENKKKSFAAPGNRCVSSVSVWCSNQLSYTPTPCTADATNTVYVTLSAKTAKSVLMPLVLYNLVQNVAACCLCSLFAFTMRCFVVLSF